MLYEGNNPVLKVTAVVHMRWRGGVFHVKPRAHSALAFRISGNATITVGQKEYDIQANDILYMPQGIGYKAEYTDTEMLVIHFVASEKDSEPEIYSFQNTEPIYKLFLSALRFWVNKEPGFHVYVLSQLYMILGVILEKSTKRNLPGHFLIAISFINSNYRNGALSIDRICAEAGIGATQFRQLFKKYYQKTPTEYIMQLRLEYARNLISGGMTIEKAAYESGFNDSKYFARVVKKRLNCTPRELKNYGR